MRVRHIQNLNNFASENEAFFEWVMDDSGQCLCSVNFLPISMQKSAALCAIG
jgi:hypothetical protein